MGGKTNYRLHKEKIYFKIRQTKQNMTMQQSKSEGGGAQLWGAGAQLRGGGAQLRTGGLRPTLTPVCTAHEINDTFDKEFS